MLQNFAESGDDAVDPGLDNHPLPFPDGVQHFRHPIGPDEHRDEGEASGELNAN